MVAYAHPSQSALRPKATGMNRPGRAAGRQASSPTPSQDDRAFKPAQKTSSSGNGQSSMTPAEKQEFYHDIIQQAADFIERYEGAFRSEGLLVSCEGLLFEIKRRLAREGEAMRGYPFYSEVMLSVDETDFHVYLIVREDGYLLDYDTKEKGKPWHGGEPIVLSPEAEKRSDYDGLSMLHLLDEASQRFMWHVLDSEQKWNEVASRLDRMESARLQMQSLSTNASILKSLNAMLYLALRADDLFEDERLTGDQVCTVQLIPTDIWMPHYRNTSTDRETILRLQKHIRSGDFSQVDRQAIEASAWLDLHNNAKVARVWEGTHRIVALKEMGIKFVPARVVFSDKEAAESFEGGPLKPINLSSKSSSSGLQLGWPIVLSSTILTTILLWPFFSWGVLPVASLHWFIGSGVASLIFSIWKHEKAHQASGGEIHWLGGKGRWGLGLKGPHAELAEDKSLWQNQARDGMAESGKLAGRFFGITLGLFLLSILVPSWLAKPLAELSAMLIIPTFINAFFFFFSAFFGEDGLQASGLKPEAEQNQEIADRLIAELKELFKEDRVFIDAIDAELRNPETAQRLKQRLERGEPIWRYETAIVYDAQQNRFKNNIDEFRPEFHERPLTVEAPLHSMSSYYYLDADNDLAKSSEIGRTFKTHLEPKPKGQSRSYIYHMEGSNATSPIADGVIIIRRGSMEIGGKVLKGIIVDTDGCKEGIPLRIDELIGQDHKRIFIRSENVNRYTLDRLYDHKKIAEENGWVVLEKQKRSFRPFSSEKRQAFEEIFKKDSVYKWSCITDFFSMATNGMLAAVLLPEIYKMAQTRFGILALALLAIRLINTIAMLIGQSHAGTRVRQMENNLSRIEALKTRGGGLGQAIRQEVDARIKRFHGGWWPLSILTQRTFFLLLYPFIFMFLWSSYPFAIQKTIFICLYIVWGIVGMGTAPLEERNRYFLTEKAGGRGYFKDARKEGLADNFWRAQAFRLNLNMLIQFSALVFTVAVLNVLGIGLIESWVFFGIFFIVALIGRPLLRVLIMPYGEDVDSKLVIYSNNPPEPKIYFAKGNIYERRFRFEDIGITISSDDPDFRPEKMRDYSLGNLYGVPLRIAEVLEQRPIFRSFGLVDRVQAGRFRVDELYIIHDPDRLGISLRLDDHLRLSSIEGEAHNIIKPVRREWNITRDGTRVIQIRQYLPSDHLKLSPEAEDIFKIESEKAKEDEARHKRRIKELTDETFFTGDLSDSPLSSERQRIVDTLLRRSVVYIGGVAYTYDYSSGQIKSDLGSFKESPKDKGHIYTPYSPPIGLEGYNFLQVDEEDGVFLVCHYERPKQLPETGFIEGVRVVDGKIKVDYSKSSSSGRLKEAETVTIEVLEGDLRNVPVDRILNTKGLANIRIEKSLADSEIETVLPDFKKEDSKDGRFDLFRKNKYTLLDRILLWRRPQRAKDQRSKNLKYGEMFAHLPKNLSYGFLIGVALFVFRKMGEGIEKLAIEAFWRFAIFIIIPVLTGAFMSERTDRITKLEDSQSLAQQSKGDLGIDRKVEAFDELNRGMGWSAISTLFFGALLTLVLVAIGPLSAGTTTLFWLNPGTAFVILGLSIGAMEMLNWRIVERTWWKLLEDLVRNNPLLGLLGYLKEFFEYLGIGTAINFAAISTPIALFFLYGSFGIFPFTTFTAGTSGWAVTGLTPLGYGLSIAAIIVIVLGRFVFPIYARFGGDSKLVIDVPDKNYIIENEEWKKNENGTNGNSRTLIRRWFRFSDGLVISTSDPKCFPMFSKLGSTRPRKRFVILDPEKYEIEYGYDKGIDVVVYDSDKNRVARTLRNVAPAKRLRILKGKRSQIRLYDYVREGEDAAKSSSAGMRRRDLLKTMFLAGAAAVVASKAPAAALELTTSGRPWQGHLKERLKALGYTDESFSVIEGGFTELLEVLDREFGLDDLKKQLNQKESPKVAKTLFKIGALLNQRGFFNNKNPKPFLRELVKGLDEHGLYESSNSETKKRLDRDLITCAAIGQFMHILLSLLEVDNSAVDHSGINPPRHALNVVKLPNGNIILADFTIGRFFEIDLKTTYMPDRTGRYLLIADSLIRPERRRELLALRNAIIDGRILPAQINLRGINNLELCYVLYSEIEYVNESGFSPHICAKFATQYGKSGEFDNAIDMYGKGINLNKGLAELYYGRSLYFKRSKRPKEAIKEAQKAVSIKPHFSEGWRALANYHHGEDNRNEARRAYGRASRLRPDSPMIHYEVGCLEYNTKEYARAVVYFKRSIKTAPNFPEAYFMLGCAYKNQQREEEADEQFIKACRLKPELLNQFEEEDRARLKSAIEAIEVVPIIPSTNTVPDITTTNAPIKVLPHPGTPKSSSAGKTDSEKIAEAINHLGKTQSHPTYKAISDETDLPYSRVRRLLKPERAKPVAVQFIRQARTLYGILLGVKDKSKTRDSLVRAFDKCANGITLLTYINDSGEAYRDGMDLLEEISARLHGKEIKVRDQQAEEYDDEDERELRERIEDLQEAIFNLEKDIAYEPEVALEEEDTFREWLEEIYEEDETGEFTDTLDGIGARIERLIEEARDAVNKSSSAGGVYAEIGDSLVKGHRAESRSSDNIKYKFPKSSSAGRVDAIRSIERIDQAA